MDLTPLVNTVADVVYNFNGAQQAFEVAMEMGWATYRHVGMHDPIFLHIHRAWPENLHPYFKQLQVLHTAILFSSTYPLDVFVHEG